jgi:sugar/nucleoside kinase (ribokinase family)
MGAPRVLVVGHLDLDRIKTESAEKTGLLGGSALYTAMAAAIRGSPVGLISTICRDYPKSRFNEATGERISSDLVQVLGTQRRNDMDYTAATEGLSDRLSHGYSKHRWQEKCEFHAPKHVPSVFGSETDILHISPMLPRYQRLYAEWGTDNGLLVSLDSSEYYAENFSAEFTDLIELVDMLLLSEAELSHILSSVPDRPESKIAEVLEMGPKVVVVRQGKQGALISDEESLFSVDALTATVVDPTGAGDSFNGGLLATYPDEDLDTSTKFGAATAKRCIEHFGLEGLCRSNPDDIEELAESVNVSY